MSIGRWQPLRNGCIKINVDGSVSKAILRVSIGTVARGPSRGWLVCFKMILGMNDIFQIEARAILERLQLDWARGFQNIEFESDNALLIKTIRNGLATISSILEVRQINVWCSKPWDVKFRHIQRNASKVADCIAKLDGEVLEQLVILDYPPHNVRCKAGGRYKTIFSLIV